MGELAAIGSAFLWAVSSIIFVALAGRMEPLVVNVLRMAVASFFLGLAIALVAVFGSLGEMTVGAGLALAGTSLLTMAVGDTMYISSLGMIGAARGVPIATTLYPVLTFILAAAFLGEEMSWPIVLGTALVVVGIFFVARSPSGGAEARPTSMPTLARGVALALAAGCVWALGTIWLRAVIDDGAINPLVATAVRVPSAALVLLLFAVAAQGPARLSLRRYEPRALGLAAVSGLIGTFLGSLLYVFSVQEAGAGKAAVLASTAPLFALPLAALLLAERPTAKVAMGTLLAVSGMFLVV